MNRLVRIPIALLLIALVAALTMNFSSYILGRSHGIQEALEILGEKEVIQRYSGGHCIEEIQQGEWILCEEPQLDENGCETTPTKVEGFGEIFLCNRQ